MDGTQKVDTTRQETVLVVLELLLPAIPTLLYAWLHLPSIRIVRIDISDVRKQGDEECEELIDGVLQELDPNYSRNRVRCGCGAM